MQQKPKEKYEVTFKLYSHKQRKYQAYHVLVYPNPLTVKG